MKLKKIMLVTLVLLAILTISAVSAADDADFNETLTVDDADEVSIDTSSDNEMISESDDDVVTSEDYEMYMDVSIPDKIITSGREYFDEQMTIYLPWDVDDYKMNVYFDEKVYRTFGSGSFLDISFDDEFYEFLGNSGDHSWKVEFLGDGKYNPKTLEGTFYYSQIEIDFSDETDSEYIIFKIYAPKGANGYVTVNINGKQMGREKFVNDEDLSEDYYDLMRMSVETGLKEKQFGLYPYTISYTGDNKLYDVVKNGTLNYHYTFDVDHDDEIYIGSSTDFTILLPEDVTGKVDITIDGVTETVKAEPMISKEIEGMRLFNHTIVVRYYGGNYPENSTTFNLYVREYWDGEHYVNYNQNAIVNLTMNRDAKGKLVVKLDDEVIASANFVEGTASVKLPILPLGEHVIVCEYQGSDYKIEPKEEYVNVSPVITVPEMHVGDKKYLEIEYPSDATGDLKVWIDGEERDVEFKNGKARLSLADLDVGEWVLKITYENGNYPDYEDDYIIDVRKPLPKIITPKFPDVLTVGDKATFTFTLPKDATGKMEVIIFVDEMYGDWDVGSADIKSGKVTVYVTPHKAGTWSLCYYYDGDDKYDSVSEAVEVTVVPSGKITAKDLTMQYLDGSKYTVTVYNNQGKTVGNGQLVTFYVGSKKIGTAKTNSKGQASLKITAVPGTYKIKTVSKGAVSTKTLKVKRVLTFKTVTVKKSAKKLVLTASLAKVKGKYLKGKVISFKFNGKTYKVKTNKKGVAKVTIKSSLLKKLKVGKKVTYQATYSKDTVKKTAIVKK